MDGIVEAEQAGAALEPHPKDETEPTERSAL